MNSEEKQKLSIGQKITYSFYSAMLFFFLSSPILYQFIQKLYGSSITMSDNGCPTYMGLIIHTILYFLIILILMSIS